MVLSEKSKDVYQVNNESKLKTHESTGQRMKRLGESFVSR